MAGPAKSRRKTPGRKPAGCQGKAARSRVASKKSSADGRKAKPAKAPSKRPARQPLSGPREGLNGPDPEAMERQSGL